MTQEGAHGWAGLPMDQWHFDIAGLLATEGESGLEPEDSAKHKDAAKPGADARRLWLLVAAAPFVVALAAAGVGVDGHGSSAGGVNAAHASRSATGASVPAQQARPA